MKRVLVGFIMDGNAGGIDKYLLNFLDAAHSKDIQIDFLTNKIDAKLKEKLSKYHSNLFGISSLKHPVRQYKQTIYILQKGKYDVVYLNVSTAIDCIVATAAKHCHVKKRMIHSHSAGNDIENSLKRQIYNIIHSICKAWLYKQGTHFYACSQKAGLWLFPTAIVKSTHFELIYNAIDKKSFVFNEFVRKEIREELKLQDQFVVGHVGNFCYQKNHRFLLQVFAELTKMETNAKLLLIGKGVQFEEMKQLAQELGIKENVMFLGWRRDVNKLLQAMDLFLLPSNFEGLPIVGIEAQCAGLPCLFSDTITDEARITDKCYFYPLEKGPKKWAQSVMAQRTAKREKTVFLGEEKRYDISECSYPHI